MTELTLTTFLSLDGVMQAPGGPDEDQAGGFRYGGWLVPHADEDMGRVIDDIFSRADAFLLGRTTYDIFASYWPQVTDADNPVASKLNRLPKYVPSRTRTEFPWTASTHIRNVVEELPALRERHQREIQVHGSCGLAQTLLRHDLIDEFRLFTFPVVIGSGKRLFGSGTNPANLRLQRTETTSRGVVVSVYRRGGAIVTGTFSPDEEA